MADQPEEDKKSGGPGILIPLIVMTLLSAGAGLACGMFLFAGSNKEVETAKEAKSAKSADKKKKGKGGDKYGKKKKKKGKHAKGDKDEDSEDVAKKPPVNRILEVPAITVNVGKTKKNWIRLELKAVTSEEKLEDEAVLLHRVSQDLVSFLRNSDIKDLQSASGYYTLRGDLNEIVRVRSGNKISEVLIMGLIVE